MAGDTKCHGYIIYDDTVTLPTKKLKPLVLVAHAWRGQDDFAKQKAQALAKLGFVSFVVDYYGEGKTATTSDQAAALMKPLFLDRKLLQERMQAALQSATSLKIVDSTQVAVIGFCFGGLAAIELFRSGANIARTVTFHAVLGNTLSGIHAKTVPIASEIPGSLLILHGYDDPLVSQSDSRAIQIELQNAKVDWQMVLFGNTQHAFTVPDAKEPTLGLSYNKTSAERSWLLMKQFFSEAFTLLQQEL